MDEEQSPDQPKARMVVAPDEETMIQAGGNPLPPNERLKYAGREVPTLPNYTIEDMLGQGGMSVVYRATQHKPHRSVALKVLRAPKREGHDRYRELSRFRREAAVVALLTHPYIVPIFEFGETEEGEPFYTMPMVNGVPLDEHVEYRKMSVREMVALFVGVCEGVEAAHRMGAMHRDIKPDNVMVTDDGRPQILDFGLAKLLTDPDEPEERDVMMDSASDSAFQAKLEISSTDEVVGTPAYMAPEQVGGYLLDTRTDVYALGVMFYRIITGSYPYDLGYSLSDAIRAISLDPPGSARELCKEVDRDLDAVLLKSLSKKRSTRYQSAAAFAADLRAWLEGRPVSARPNTVAYRVSRFVRRNRALSAVAVAAFVALNATVGISFWQITLALTEEKTAKEREESQRMAAELAKIAAVRSEFESQASLADSLTAQGDSLSLLGEWVQAREKYKSALEVEAARTVAIERAKLGLWQADRKAPRPLLTLAGHEGGALAIAISADGKTLASSGADGTVRVWSYPSGREIAMFKASETAVFHLSMDASGRRVASGDWDGGVRLLSRIALSPDGRLLAVAREAGDLLLLDKGLNVIAEKKLSATPVSVCWAGGDLVIGQADGVVLRFDAISGVPRWAKRMGDSPVADLMVDRKGELLVAFGQGPVIRTNGNGEKIGEITTVGVRQAAALMNGTLVWADEDGVVRAGSEAMPLLDACARTVGMAANSAFGIGALSMADGRVVVHALRRGGGRTVELAGVETTEAVWLDSEMGMCATGGRDGTIRLWDLESGKLLQKYDGHQRAITSLAISRDRTALLSGSLDRTVRTWPLSNAKRGRILSGPEEVVRSVAYDGAGRVVALYRSGVVAMTTAAGGALEVPVGFKSPTDRVLGLDAGSGVVRLVMANGSTVAVKDNRITEEVIAAGHAFAVSAGRRWRATALRGGRVDLRGVYRHEFVAHDDGVTTLAFRGERQLLTGGRDGVIRFWQIGEEGVELLHSVVQHRNAVTALEVDGNWLLSSGRDGKTYLSNLGVAAAAPAKGETLAGWFAGRKRWAEAAELIAVGVAVDDPVWRWRIAWCSGDAARARELAAELKDSPAAKVLARARDVTGE
jgi:serine/threonine protein kinase/WD40 repeat protein